MLRNNLILLAIFVMGLIFNNSLIAAGSGTLLVLRFLRLHAVVAMLDKRSLDAGLLLLLISVLAPFAMERVSLADVGRAFRQWDGLIAVAGGLIAAYLCGKGVVLLQEDPQVIVGLVAGTIIGVFLLRGVPIGPLAAAGFAAVLMQLARLFKR